MFRVKISYHYFSNFSIFMPLTIHLLAGAAIVGLTINLWGIWPGLFLALISHYLFDALPHWDYSIENIKKRLWKKALPEFIKIFLDTVPVLTIIFIVSKNIYLVIGAVLAGFPDLLFFLNCLFPNKILSFLGEKIHNKIHYPGQKTRLFRRACITFLIFILLFYIFLAITVNSPLA